MRRRLAVWSLVTTALIVLSLLIPLGLLVRRQAADGARLQAEREAQTTAALIALAVSLETETSDVEVAVGPIPQGVLVTLSDGSSFGRPWPGQGSLIAVAMSNQATIAELVDGGWELALPVIGLEGVAVVDVYVTDATLTEGVGAAWLLLGVLGVVLTALAVLVADRLGRRLVRPLDELARSAHRMSEGDLDARVEVAEPKEMRDLGEAFNHLASRLDHLLIGEREAVADLSHRLRTPLASLRLQTERISDPTERTELLAQVDRLGTAIDQLILAARSRDSSSGRCSMDLVVSERAAFWRVLADEEHRDMAVILSAGDVELGISRDTLEAAIDSLIGNVFAHTPEGTALTISTGESSARPWLEVADFGSGFASRELLDRGVSGAGSTGLGLDIVNRTAALTGGEVETHNRPEGGAVVRVWFG